MTATTTLRPACRDDVVAIIAMLADDALGRGRERIEDPLPQCYFDAFERIGDFGILRDLPKVATWRTALAARPSIRTAVAPEYPALLWEFLRKRGSHLSRLMDGKALAA